MEDDLRTTVASVVNRFGFARVYEAIREIAPPQVRLDPIKETDGPKQVPSKRIRTKPRLSAVEYVRTIDVSGEQAQVLTRAARGFERRTFLPTLGDLRNFYEVYGIEEPRSKSRVSAIPRIFKFLAQLETTDLEGMLNNPTFAGPAKLGPIAAAIRSKSKGAGNLKSSDR